MKGKIVINASPPPIILLHKVDLESVLPALFSSIIVPNGVMEEISVHEEDEVAHRIRSQRAFTICGVTLEPLVQAWDLGRGETDVISFAYHHPAHIPVLDDSAAKACCRSFGLKALGTGTILILAKQNGLLRSVRDALLMLRDRGMWISESVVDLLSRRAGEV
jgi:predicted nucleic acid-binding protein